MSKWSAKAVTSTVTTVTAGSKIPLLTPTPGNEFITVENIVADSILTNAFQAKDAGLTSISGLTTAADKMIYTTALDTYAVADLSAFARTLLDDADASTARGTLGLVIGTDVQAYDADLTTWAGLTPSANAQSLVTAANYAAMRTLLDVESGVDFDPVGTDNSTNVTLAGSLDYLSLAGQVLTLGSIDLTTDVTGTLPVGNGGTGLTSISTLLNSNVTPATLGLVIGTNVQAYNANLTAINQALTTTSSPTFVGLTLSGAVSGITTLGASGAVTAPQFTLSLGGTPSAGTMYRSATNGTYIWGSAGSSNDWTLSNSVGGTWLLLPTGTVNPRFTGNIQIDGTLSSGALTVTGAMSATTTISAPRINGSTGTGKLLLYGDSAATLGATLYDTGQLDVTGGTNRVGRFIQTATSISSAVYTFEIDSSSHSSNMTAAGAFLVKVNAGNALVINGNGAMSGFGAWSTTGTLASGAHTLNGNLIFSAGYDVSIIDNSGAALTFTQGGNPYLRFVSTNGSEAINVFKTLALQNVNLTLGSGTITTTGTLASGALTVASNGGQAVFKNSISAASSVDIRLQGGASSTLYNWLIGKDFNANDALEFTPSTVGGGTTFSTPVLTLRTTGATVTGTGTFSSYLEGTTTNGFLDLRGDSGATKGVRILDTGLVGIGTTAPGTKLEVNRHTQAAASATGLTTVANSALTLGAQTDTNNRLAFGIGDGSYSWIQSQNVSSNTSLSISLNPIGGSVIIGATATSNNAQLYATKTYSAASGTDASAFFSHSQSVATTGGLQGVTSIVAATHTTGTVGAVYGILGYGRASGAGGTTTNAYGGYFNVQNLSASAVITTACGVYIAGFTATGTITNRWGIYQAGASENNYLAGSLGIGTTTVTPALLNLGASTTSKASLNIPSGTAPTSPTNGDIWSDGSDLKVRLGGTTYTLTKA
jgi:hypothetical protein